MAILHHGATHLPLPALDPPDELLFAYEACQEMRALIQSGEITYSAEGIRAWAQGGATSHECQLREQKLGAIKRLLKGERLAQADARFADAYQAYLHRYPRARAAALIAKSALRAGAHLDGLPEGVVDALLAS